LAGGGFFFTINFNPRWIKKNASLLAGIVMSVFALSFVTGCPKTENKTVQPNTGAVPNLGGGGAGGATGVDVKRPDNPPPPPKI